MVKRIKVHTLEALKDPSYRFPNNYGVEKFLELFSGKCLLTEPLFFDVYLQINCIYWGKQIMTNEGAMVKFSTF